MTKSTPHIFRRARLVAAVSAIALAAACATGPTPEQIHDRNWQVAITADAPPAYEAYLRQHPAGLYTATAHTRIAELNAQELVAWEETLKVNTEQAYADFAYRYAWGPHRIRAEALRDERAAPRLAAEEAADWSTARSEDIIPAYEDFLARWPDGANARAADARLAALWKTDEGVFIRAVRSNSPAQLEDFLRYYSDSEFVPDARRELELFRIRDDEAWRRALSYDSIDAYDEYLQENPFGAWRREAQDAIQSLRDRDYQAWQYARRLDTYYAYDNYRRAYPWGGWYGDAGIRLDYFRRSGGGGYRQSRTECGARPESSNR